MTKPALRPLVVSTLLASAPFLPTTAVAAEVDEAIELLKQTHDDRCEQQKLRGRLLIAHQSHDTSTLDALTPQLEALNNRLKPAEAQLKALQATFQDVSKDRDAFEKAQIDMGECD